MKSPAIPLDVVGSTVDSSSDALARWQAMEMTTLSSLLENAQGPAFLIDAQGRFVLANTEANGRFGEAGGRLIGRSSSDATSGGIPLRRDKLDIVLQTKRAMLYEDCSYRGFVEIETIPLLGETGEVRFVVVFVRDITQRRQEELSLKASEHKYHLLASNFPDGMVVLVDKDLRILLADGRGTERLTVPKELLVGRKLKDVMSDEAHTTISSLYHMVLEGQAKEADVPFGGGTFHVQVIPIREEDREISALIVASDVTKQRAQENALHMSEERLKSVFDHALIGIYRTTPEGEIILANPALINLLGFTSFEELAKRNLNQAGFDANTPRRKFLERIDREGAVQDMYFTWTGADGRSIFIRDSATAIKNEEGRTIYYEGTIEDVTEKEAYKAQIIQLNQSLRIVNSILRHDILNDLTVAIGSLDLYRRKGDHNLLEMTDRSMRKCSSLIQKMKELESIISTNELRTMSARGKVQEVVAHYSSFGIDFTIEGDGIILADEAVIPALDNVISNAVLHSQTERIDVGITTDTDKQWCEIRVQDHGKGVPDEIKPFIFNEGFKYGETGNTGLGLYIVRKTMERYGGDVKVMDNKPQGSIFALRFRSLGSGKKPLP